MPIRRRNRDPSAVLADRNYETLRRFAESAGGASISPHILQICRRIVQGEDPHFRRMLFGLDVGAGIDRKLCMSLLIGLRACQAWSTDYEERGKLYRSLDYTIRTGWSMGSRLRRDRKLRSALGWHGIELAQSYLCYGYILARGHDAVLVRDWSALMPILEMIFHVRRPKGEDQNSRAQLLALLRQRARRLKRNDKTAKQTALAYIAEVYALV